LFSIHKSKKILSQTAYEISMTIMLSVFNNVHVEIITE